MDKEGAGLLLAHTGNISEVTTAPLTSQRRARKCHVPRARSPGSARWQPQKPFLQGGQLSALTGACLPLALEKAQQTLSISCPVIPSHHFYD